jgi:hypothetical protein
MKPITVSTVVDRPREEVYDFLLDLRNHEAFTDHMMVDWSGDADRVTVRSKFNKRDVLHIETIEKVRPSKTVENGVSLGGKRLTSGTYRLAEAGPGQTEVTFEFRYLKAPAARARTDGPARARLPAPPQRAGDAPPAGAARRPRSLAAGRRRLAVSARYRGGTASVSQTPLSARRKTWPSRAIAAASTSSTIARPRRPPTWRAVGHVGREVHVVAAHGQSPSRRIASSAPGCVPWKSTGGGSAGSSPRSTATEWPCSARIRVPVSS